MASARHRQPKRPDAKHPGGRPTSFRVSFIKLGYQFALLGATDRQLADFFGVSEQTLNTWKQRYPKFLVSIKRGKAHADAVVAASLYHRAIGYEHKAVKIMQSEGKSFEHSYTEHYPPDSTAAIFWLKNRCPENWRDKHHLEHEGEIKGAGGKPVEEMSAVDIDKYLAKRKEQLEQTPA